MNSQRTVSLKTTTTRLWPVCGITAGAAAMAVMLAVSLISAGCDSNSFAPPPPPELKVPARPGFAATYEGAGSAASSSVPSVGKPASRSVRIVELILARPANDDRVYLDHLLRQDLATFRIPVRLTQPDPQKRSSPEDLAGAIRAAVSRGVAGLVVEPTEDEVVVNALYEAVGRGVAVLLLDRPVPARGGKSIPLIEYTAFDDVGRQLVTAALEAGPSFKPARPGRIIILHHRSDDPYLERGFQSLVGPCRTAGKPMEILEFDGNAEQGMAVMKKSLEADPGLEILLVDDAVGVSVGFRIHFDRIKSNGAGFVLAGYLSNDYRSSTFLDLMYAMGDRSVQSYASKTSLAIRSLMESRAVGDVVEVPITFRQRSTNPNPTSKAIEAPPTARKP